MRTRQRGDSSGAQKDLAAGERPSTVEALRSRSLKLLRCSAQKAPPYRFDRQLIIVFATPLATHCGACRRFGKVADPIQHATDFFRREGTIQSC